MDSSIAWMHEGGNRQRDHDHDFNDGQPHHEIGRDFDTAVNEQGDQEREDNVHHIPGTGNVGFHLQGSLQQKAKVCQVHRAGERVVQKEHPGSEKSRLGVERSADVGVISAGRRQMKRQLGEADPKHEHDQECDQVSQRRSRARHRGNELNRDYQSHCRCDVGDALGKHRGEGKGIGSQAFGLWRRRLHGLSWKQKAGERTGPFIVRL